MYAIVLFFIIAPLSAFFLVPGTAVVHTIRPVLTGLLAASLTAAGGLLVAATSPASAAGAIGEALVVALVAVAVPHAPVPTAAPQTITSAPVSETSGNAVAFLATVGAASHTGY